MNSEQIEQKSYEMPPREGFTVFGGRILSRGDNKGGPE
jgi:hypothetical protein